MNLDFSDVLKPYKDAFWQLLAPKTLTEVSTKNQQIYYEFNSQKLAYRFPEFRRERSRQHCL